MKTLIRTADAKGRVALPGFANTTLIIEQVDDTEYRVRKAQVIPEKELRFSEENFPIQVTERDAVRLAQALAKPPLPNKAARRAAQRLRKNYG